MKQEHNWIKQAGNKAAENVKVVEDAEKMKTETALGLGDIFSNLNAVLAETTKIKDARDMRPWWDPEFHIPLLVS